MTLGIMSAEMRNSFDTQWTRLVLVGCWIVVDVWNTAEGFSGIKRDIFTELRIHMQLVGLSAPASANGAWCTCTIYGMVPASAIKEQELRVGLDALEWTTADDILRGFYV